MNSFKIGAIAKSTQGRDLGENYIIVGFEKGKVLCANGKTRKLDNPKNKNFKHLEVCEDSCVYNEYLNKNIKMYDSYIITALNDYKNKVKK